MIVNLTNEERNKLVALCDVLLSAYSKTFRGELENDMFSVYDLKKKLLNAK